MIPRRVFHFRPARRRPRRRSRPWNWTAVTAFIAALASVAGVYFTGESLGATRAQNTVTEQGQLTDRFTKAVDQLDRTGNDHLQARLGAIYALERLARDSPRDQPTIIEILSAFIRTTTPRPSPAPADAPKGTTTCPDQSVASDIQAALTVLGRRNTTHDQDSRIDLVDTCLNNADLGGAKANEANLDGAHLDGANLRDVYLNGAHLRGAHLNKANLRGAQLNDAHLNDANLDGANLFAANLGRAKLEGANLAGADLRDANLNGASR